MLDTVDTSMVLDKVESYYKMLLERREIIMKKIVQRNQPVDKKTPTTLVRSQAQAQRPRRTRSKYIDIKDAVQDVFPKEDAKKDLVNLLDMLYRSSPPQSTETGNIPRDALLDEFLAECLFLGESAETDNLYLVYKNWIKVRRVPAYKCLTREAFLQEIGTRWLKTRTEAQRLH